MTAAQTVLIVDDEPDLIELVSLTLGRMKLQTASAENLEQARAQLATRRFDLCLTDMRLPDGDGLDLVAYIQEHHPQLPVAVITAHGNVESAVRALKSGAFDFVSKPLDLGVLRKLVATAIKLVERSDGGGPGATVLNALATQGPRLMGHSPVMGSLRELIARVARSQAPVHISGESGTGKELVARLIHASGARHDGPFVPVNCGAIPSELMESELFGHKRGSFTGAIADKKGMVQSAEGGTLFLDEVADLPLHMQVKLLRLIQEKTARPIGEQREAPVDVRVLSATHKDLAVLVSHGRFREDLYYRINVIEIRVPPLREHPEDIPELADAMLQRLSGRQGLPAPRISAAARVALDRYAFPGNVRELENILERATALSVSGLIEAADLQLRPGSLPGAPAGSGLTVIPVRGAGAVPVSTSSPAYAIGAIGATGATGATGAAGAAGAAGATVAAGAIGATGAPAALGDQLESIEREAIIKALEQTRYNKTAAAKLLGMSFRALRYRVKKLRIE